jgi:hypothetical protein
MPEIKRKKRKKRIWGCLLLVIIPIFLGGVGTYLYLRFFQGKELTLSEGTMLIPEQALMATFISTNELQWDDLKITENQENKQLLTKTIEKLPTEFFGVDNISYQKDIEPWLGNLMFAVLPSVDNNYELLGILGIKNKVKAFQFANQLRRDKTYQFKLSNYRGITIIESTNVEKAGFNYALIQDKLIVARNRKTLELAVDTFQGMPSFKAHNLKEDFSLENTVINIYIPDYLRIVKEQLYDSSWSQKIPTTTIKKIGAVKSIFMGIGFQENNVHLQAIANIDNTIIKTEFTPKDSEIINKIPDTTFFLLTGNDLNKTWLRISEQGQEIPEFNYWLSESRKFFNILNIDLDREIFGWLDGDFALGISPAEQGIFNNFAGLQIASTIVLETSDRPRALLTIDKIEKLAQKTDLIEVNTRKIEEQTITEWTTFPKEILFSYMWQDEKTFLMTIGAPLDKLTQVTLENSLINTPKFEQITSNLPALNFGYFYLDMNQFMTILNTFPLTKNQPLSPEVNNLLNSFQGMAITSTMRDKTTPQIDVILSIK